MTEKTQESTARQILKKIRFALICLSIFGIFVVAVVSIQWYCWGWIETNIPEEKRGAFGDMFGSINTLFSGLAFAGVLFTIVLQGWELSATRSELKLSREAHEKSTEIMDTQLEVLQKTLEIEKVRLSHQFKPVLVLEQAYFPGGARAGAGSYTQEISNMGKPILDVSISKLNLSENDGFAPFDRRFVDTKEKFVFQDSTEGRESGSTYNYDIKYRTLDGKLWHVLLHSIVGEHMRVISWLGPTEEIT